MANRIMLNTTSYHGAGAIDEIATEAKAMHLHSIKPEEPNHNSNSVMGVQQESLETITPEVAKSVRDAMSIFRNRS